MKHVHVWVLAARPKTLPASLGLVILGSTLAFQTGFFHLPMFLMTLFCALGLQISVNYANDYFDYLYGFDTSMRKGPVRVTAAGLVPPTTMKKALILALGFTALCGVYLCLQGGVIITLLFTASLALTLAYTAGPFPLSRLGIADPFALLFFGPFATSGTYFLQTHEWSLSSFLIGIGPGMIAVALTTLNDIRDVSEDAITGKKTSIVRFGVRFGKIKYLFCLLVASSVPFLFYSNHPYTSLSLLFLLPIFGAVQILFSYKDPARLNEALSITGKSHLVYCLLCSLGWLL